LTAFDWPLFELQGDGSVTPYSRYRPGAARRQGGGV